MDEVVEVLRERLYQGQYAPGTRLLQDQLAQELGVSRTPLREALRMLEQEGLVRMEPGKGIRVISGDVPTLLQAYQVRKVMDGLAARLAAECADEEALNQLREAIGRQRRALSPWSAEKYTAENVAFHSSIMQLSGNEFVVAQMSILRITAQVFSPVAVVDKERARVAVNQHETIFQAIADRDADAAESCALEHIQTTIDSLKRRASA